jgi:hypothetical protein
LRTVIQKNKGYGNALIEGINACKTKYFYIFNADGSFDENDLPKMHDLNKKMILFLLHDMDMELVVMMTR